ncbi:hypothetical protein CDL12_23993 [Handroanthus impetiginosus]|uniref:Membrane-associated kinase regulator 4 n=1 Tax=Handroanthus impetiginosus TaxID=429701 RepID=A0A2G9GDW3_9LAMI|nr:hypothetical protein CDL12_23993 [Handroanthus impetiginosus]
MESNPWNSCSSLSSSSSDSSDYINMEVDSSFSNAISTKEFEFQSFSSSSDTDRAATSPADHLFFMGKLLPLQMVHKMLHNPTSFNHKIEPFEQESFRTPVFSPISSTPFESCNVSPSRSCHVSGELNAEEYCLDDDYLSEFQEKKSGKKKLKLIKKSSSLLGSKLKWAYLKSLFRKSSCSDKKLMGCVEIKENDLVGGSHRRSISGTLKRFTKTKTASFSCSSSKNLSRQVLRSSGSSNLELENPIQAAIAHCKKSQQKVHSGEIVESLQENISLTEGKIRHGLDEICH